MKKTIIELNQGKIIIQRKDNNEICGVMFENIPSTNLIKRKINQNISLLLNKENPIILNDSQLQTKLTEILLMDIIPEKHGEIIEQKLEKTVIGIEEEIIEEEIIEEEIIEE